MSSKPAIITSTDKALIQSEQVKQLFSGFPVTLISSFILASILGFTMRGVFDSSLVNGWLGLFTIIALVRIEIMLAYQRAMPIQNPTVWLNRFRLGTLAISSVWGLAGVLFFATHDLANQMFLIFLLTGVIAGGAIAYAIDSRLRHPICTGCAVTYFDPFIHDRW
jgi:hypothetical protein